MNLKLTILAGILIFSSCSIIRFSEPQPEGTQPLSTFPDRLTGSYADGEGDTLIVSKYSLRIGDDVNKLSDDRLVLKKMGKYYILSSRCSFLMKDSTNWEHWEVIPIRPAKNALIISLIDICNDQEKKTLSTLERIISAKIIQQPGTPDRPDYYVVDPTKKEFKIMLKEGIFNQEMTFKQIP